MPGQPWGIATRRKDDHKRESQKVKEAQESVKHAGIIIRNKNWQEQALPGLFFVGPCSILMFAMRNDDHDNFVRDFYRLCLYNSPSIHICEVKPNLVR